MKLSDVNEEFIDKTRKRLIRCNLGGDPEFFVANKRGQVLNADRFFPGKDNPMKVGEEEARCKLFFDGIQGEMSYRPARCREIVSGRIRSILMMVHNIIKENRVILKPSSRIQRSIIDQADPEARIFGCAPDFNAYTRSVNTCEMDASRHPFRYAGGHLHFGTSEPLETMSENNPEKFMVKEEEMHLRLIKMMDLLITIPTLPLDNAPGSKRRRDKYGKAGCFRPTPYGIEYRTPSCWWLKSPMTVSLVYALGRMAWSITAYKMDKRFYQILNTDEEEVRGIINESDIEASNKLWEKMRSYLALMFEPGGNPLNLFTIGNKSLVSTNVKSITLMQNKSLNFDKVLSNYFSEGRCRPGKLAHGLAMMDYLRSGADSEVISNRVVKEWDLPRKAKESQIIHWSNGVDYNGFIQAGTQKMARMKDFIKYQASLMKELGCEHSFL